jgi:hypothetical protein
MKYFDGKEVHIGDKVIADGSEGIVVCVIDTKQFSKEWPEGWAYLQRGMLVNTKKWGLIHYPEVDEDVVLAERGITDSSDEVD